MKATAMQQQQHHHHHHHHHQRRVPMRTATILLLLLLLSIYSVDRTQAIYVRTEPGDTPSYCSVFHHMVKSAGSTVKNILNVAAYETGETRPVVCVKGYDPECVDGLKMSPVIAGLGEIVREPLKNSGRECEYFTMMREPIERIVSAFFYCPTDHDVVHRPLEHCGYANVPEPATERLMDFATTGWGSQAFRQLTFSIYCPPDSLCEPAPEPRPRLSLDDPDGAILFQKVEDILSTYTAVGVVEYFDLSMELFQARVKSPVRDFTIHKQPANPGKTSSLREEVLEWAKNSPELHRVMEADIGLYNYSVELFKAQTSEALGTVWTD